MDDQATYQNPERAQRTVDQLMADADGWRYEVEHRGKYAVIAVYDAEGVKLGYL